MREYPTRSKRPCLQDEPVFCPVPKLSDLCFQAIRNADVGMEIELKGKQCEIERLRNELQIHETWVPT